MGLAFWKNGFENFCIAPPFFEACPYTWEGEILMKLEDLDFFSSFIFAKCRVHLDLHIDHWNFSFMKK